MDPEPSPSKNKQSSSAKQQSNFGYSESEINRFLIDLGRDGPYQGSHKIRLQINLGYEQGQEQHISNFLQESKIQKYICGIFNTGGGTLILKCICQKNSRRIVHFIEEIRRKFENEKKVKSISKEKINFPKYEFKNNQIIFSIQGNLPEDDFLYFSYDNNYANVSYAITPQKQLKKFGKEEIQKIQASYKLKQYELVKYYKKLGRVMPTKSIFHAQDQRNQHIEFKGSEIWLVWRSMKKSQTSWELRKPYAQFYENLCHKYLICSRKDRNKGSDFMKIQSDFVGFKQKKLKAVKVKETLSVHKYAMKSSKKFQCLLNSLYYYLIQRNDGIQSSNLKFE